MHVDLHLSVSIFETYMTILFVSSPPLQTFDYGLVPQEAYKMVHAEASGISEGPSSDVDSGATSQDSQLALICRRAYIDANHQCLT